MLENGSGADNGGEARGFVNAGSRARDYQGSEAAGFKISFDLQAQEKVLEFEVQGQRTHPNHQDDSNLTSRPNQRSGCVSNPRVQAGEKRSGAEVGFPD